jgi:hypothetical protein
MLLHDFVTLHVLVQLLISELVVRLEDDHWGVPEEEGDLNGGV